LTAKELMCVLEDMGFSVLRQAGSHVFMKHADGRTTTVPNHPGKNLIEDY